MRSDLYKSMAYWLVLWIALFVFLHYYSEYHFYLIEQNQLFQWSMAYWLEGWNVPGAVSTWVSEFLVQFFLLPYGGAGICAVLLTGVGIGTSLVMKRILSDNRGILLSLLPAIFLLFTHFDFNYLVSGTVAYLFLLIFLNGVIRIKEFRWRWLAALAGAALLFYIAGPVSVLFAGIITLYELCNRTPRGYLMLLVCAEVFLLGLLSVHLSWIGESRYIFLPDGYYHPKLAPKQVTYYAWIILPVLFLIAFGWRRRAAFSGKLLYVSVGFQLLLVAGLLWWGIDTYGDAKAYRVKKLDYFSRTGQWDRILEECKGELTNYLYMCYVNMALAQKGELGNQLFSYDQRGLPGLIIPWNQTNSISILLSDVYFTIGDMGSAQQMAFEAYIGSTGKGNPRMLQRLVETNLVYGSYAVAEKYIRMLENTWGYARWAKEKRSFLYQDERVVADSFLGKKRRNLPEGNFLSQIHGITQDLFMLAGSDPDNRAAIEYAGAVYLLSKDNNGFREMVETYYGTPVLPELPVHFQEAVISIWENDPSRWEYFRVSEPVKQRFTDFKKQVLANRQHSAALPNLLRRSHGNSYWYYLMFK